MKKFAMTMFSRRDINNEKMVCGNWRVFVKSLEDYDNCLLIYHKCDGEYAMKAADMVYLFSDDGVNYKEKSPQSMLRQASITPYLFEIVLFLLEVRLMVPL